MRREEAERVNEDQTAPAVTMLTHTHTHSPVVFVYGDNLLLLIIYMETSELCARSQITLMCNVCIFGLDVKLCVTAYTHS